MSLLFALAAVTASCSPNPSLAAAAGAERVRAYFAAINAKDAAAIGRFLAPGAIYSNPQVPGMSLADVMNMLLSAPTVMQLEVTEVRAQEDGILVRTRASDGSTAGAVVRLDGGCIRTFTQTP